MQRVLIYIFVRLVFQINDLPKPSYMNKTISDLKIGTYENIETVAEDTTIILALKKFVERRVSALPVLDEKGRLVDIFAKFDVIVSPIILIIKNFYRFEKITFFFGHNSNSQN